MKKIILFLILITTPVLSQEIALLKYSGGGDWYANPTSLPNLIKFCNQNINTTIKTKPVTVTPASADIFSYPFIHMTGHGNVVFNDAEVQNLQNYLRSGGFLHIDDNYGMNQYIRKEISKLFPNEALVEIPANHAIFQKPFPFTDGLPKIHEHDGKRPQAFGIFIDTKLVLLYTYECDLGDGWEDPEVHNDPPAVREKALKMGANIMSYIFKN
ncbi:DUF4159 domain-containing protein [Flavobacterium psychrophilum]|uniref:DUF4159 domain-containing protein n=1 Tax=Flavobacterium psychrophilum TaxID=96345 RepID=UPI0004F8506B|nr:DUF4159 domain-containing protein [Flavobacterium psychrophilum]AIN74594.1 hypothetical protein FPG3_09960 [Flavobacterium psychrophilum FPG3]EKT2068264.1 DUF4159 domain-containing protein [Flavobacterium psychrophilum]EKT2072379.1 DUF4159 domain-containing protein [Flavobacterium psychrophilum]EKT4491871.1 DUF4159 domain-containing protein [Flavobacterium psychrophilum]EKT4549962.1 DUF4159 domain-containing protein [Flavobacterium psychrophilum]